MGTAINEAKAHRARTLTVVRFLPVSTSEHCLGTAPGHCNGNCPSCLCLQHPSFDEKRENEIGTDIPVRGRCSSRYSLNKQQLETKPGGAKSLPCQASGTRPCTLNVWSGMCWLTQQTCRRSLQQKAVPTQETGRSRLALEASSTIHSSPR